GLRQDRSVPDAHSYSPRRGITWLDGPRRPTRALVGGFDQAGAPAAWRDWSSCRRAGTHPVPDERTGRGSDGPFAADPRSASSNRLARPGAPRPSVLLRPLYGSNPISRPGVAIGDAWSGKTIALSRDDRPPSVCAETIGRGDAHASGHARAST